MRSGLGVLGTSARQHCACCHGHGCGSKGTGDGLGAWGLQTCEPSFVLLFVLKPSEAGEVAPCAKVLEVLFTTEIAAVACQSSARGMWHVTVDQADLAELQRGQTRVPGQAAVS